MQYVLDTNILLRTLIEEDEKSKEECTRILEKIKKGEIDAIIPGIVISEIMWVLKSSYGLEPAMQIKATKSILCSKNMKILDDYDYALAIGLYENTEAKYVDCLITTLAGKINATVITYDKEFKRFPIEWATPAELLASLK